MKQAIVLLLKKDRKIEKLRDRRREFPHITLVYTFELNDQKALDQHIKESIKKIKPFKLSLNGLKKSAKDYYVYLLVNKGKSQLNNLQSNLLSGILKNFKNKDLPSYIPHLTLGIFKNKTEREEAITILKKEKPFFEQIINGIQLINLKDNKIKSVKTYKLK